MKEIRATSLEVSRRTERSAMSQAMEMSAPLYHRLRSFRKSRWSISPAWGGRQL